MLAPPRPHRPLTLGILAAPCEIEAALALCTALALPLGEAVILLDAEEAPRLPRPRCTRIAARPLAGDFGSQRNALQRLARTPWVLQLDTDETIGRNALLRLGQVIAAAERDGVVSLGLPRRNHVNGVLSDHYPDPQYRLNRRTVRFDGQVHERPEVPGRALRMRLALGVPIAHRLTAKRVRARTARYGTMSDGATDTARRGDEQALLTPFRP